MILETINREMGADVKIFDAAKHQVTDFQVQSATAFRSKFPVSCGRAHQKHNRSATAWALTRQTLKDISTHPTISQVLSSRHCRLIHHQWPLDVTNTTSVGFFVRATPTYTLSSSFKQDRCTLIAKKASTHRKKILKFQVALTVVRATMMNPETQKDSREAWTAFELQVPASQRRVMEELFTKSFKGSTANDLNFIYYKQRHHHHDVFYRAVQAQRLHEESYRVVAVEGIQDIQHIFHFDFRLQQQFPEIESILPTLKSTAPNDHGLPIRLRYYVCWILCRTTNLFVHRCVSGQVGRRRTPPPTECQVKTTNLFVHHPTECQVQPGYILSMQTAFGMEPTMYAQEYWKEIIL
jgi:hypothetical protein